jgi:hypothetical protein
LIISRNIFTIFLVIHLSLNLIILAQSSFESVDSPTQDWIFGDAPEPKWVTALLKGSHSIPEDTEFILSVPMSRSAVTYEAIVDSNADFKITNDHLIITPKKDFNGYIFVDLKLDMSFMLKVVPVNDIPILAEIEPQSVEEDTEFSYNLFALDMDDDKLTYGATIDGNGIVETESDILTIIPKKNYNGPISVSIAVSDGKDTQESEFKLQVIPINDAPVLDTIMSQSIIEDSHLKLLLSANDVDGDLLTYNADAGKNATVKIEENKLSITPENNFNGNIDVSVYVDDGTSKDELKFVLKVIPINDAPVLTSIIPESKKEKKIGLQMLASDIDGDKLIYSADTKSNADITVKDNLLTVKPNKDYKGTVPLTLKTFDGSSSVDTNITIINPIPGILTIAPQYIKEDTELVLKLMAKDIEGDGYIFKSNINENSKNEVIDNKLIIKPNKDYFGKIDISLTVTDKKDSTNFNFDIDVTPVEDAPIAIAGEDLIISDGCNTSFTLDGTKSWDPDGDQLMFKWELLNQNKSTVFDTSVVKYFFSDSTIDRELLFVLTVSDMTGLNDHDTLLVKLINDNQPIADAGIDFIAPINKKVYLDGSGSKDVDNILEYKWDVLEDEINLSQLESSKPKPHFLYPKNLIADKTYTFVLNVKDNNSYCEDIDTVLVTCKKNVGIAEDVKFELISVNKKDKKVFINLDITNQQSWPLDFAAITLIRVKNEINMQGQIDPYKGKNTVKYGIENGEKIGVELVYNFETPPTNVTILCKPSIKIVSDSVMYALDF